MLTIPIHRKSFKIVKNNLPTYSFYEREESFYKLGSQIIATSFVKNGYSDKFYGVCIPRLQINYLRRMLGQTENRLNDNSKKYINTYIL